ncbi:MAG: flagellin FliC [Deltaproteobacteria bacterium]|nr:flagellin FliC [Deltaproteobacteria bacterium]
MAIKFDNTDISIINTNLARVRRELSINVKRLSTGYRINSASDDPSGLAISQVFDAQVRSLGQAIRNANDGVSLVQIAEGGLEEISSVLSRMRELAVQSKNGSLTDSDRATIDTEYQALKAEIDRISDATEFNGTKLLNTAGTFTFQVGINNSTTVNTITVSTSDVNTDSIGTTGGSTELFDTTVSTTSKASTAIDSLDVAIGEINTVRARMGAAVNRLDYAVSYASSARDTLTQAKSRIKDVDVATETASYTRNQILLQAGASLLAQANVVPTIALQILQGR